jgi:hypothetical protein
MFLFISGLCIGFICGYIVYRNENKNLRFSEGSAKARLAKSEWELNCLRGVQASPFK